jgi:teichuronic acid biosynthesis glycosyltransferase TuaC
MRVLILSHMYPYALEPTFGLFVHNQVKELARHCEVVVVSPTPLSPPVVRRWRTRWMRYASKPGQTHLEGVEVHYPRYLNIPGQHGFPLSALFYTWAIRGLVARLKNTFDFDLIHAHAICPDGFAAARLGRMVNTPAVCTMHGADINVYPHRTRLTGWVTRKGIRSVDRIITVSSELRANTLALASPQRDVQVIPNGVDLRKFAPMDRAQARVEMGLPQDQRILLYASRLDEAKGLSFLVAALKRVLHHDGDCLLVLAGEGPFQSRLAEQIAELELEGNVHFVGLRPHDEIPKWMCACDLLVLPSLNEGSPLPVYEALACGRPVVASRVGGIPELIVEEDYGLLVPPADPEALSRALLSGLQKEWDVERIRRHGERFSWGRVADRLLLVYDEVLASCIRSRSSPAGPQERA